MDLVEPFFRGLEIVASSALTTKITPIHNHAHCPHVQIRPPSSFDSDLATTPQIATSATLQHDMIEFGSSSSSWSFEPAITLLKATANGDPTLEATEIAQPELSPLPTPAPQYAARGGLGDFTQIWKHLGVNYSSPDAHTVDDAYDEAKLGSSIGSDASQLVKAVKWRDEQDGADLEDNVEPEQVTASNLRTRKRAARRARARERELQLAQATFDPVSDTASDGESGEELESVRRSPDRRSLIADLVGRPRPRPTENISPPTSPSPPKERAVLRTPTKKEWPTANPFLWSTPILQSSTSKNTILPTDGLTPYLRKVSLISQLSLRFPDEQKYLKNEGLRSPAFSPLNTSPIGIHGEPFNPLHLETWRPHANLKKFSLIFPILLSAFTTA